MFSENQLTRRQVLSTLEKFGNVGMFMMTDIISYIDHTGNASLTMWTRTMNVKGWSNTVMLYKNRKYISLKGLLLMMQYMNIPNQELVKSVYDDFMRPPRIEESTENIKKLREKALWDNDVKEFQRLTNILERRGEFKH